MVDLNSLVANAPPQGPLTSHVVGSDYEIAIDLQSSPPVVVLRGAIDAQAGASLAALLEPFRSTRSVVSLDLGGVRMIDSSGLQPILRSCQEWDRPMVITAASLAVTELLGAVALPPLLSFAADRDRTPTAANRETIGSDSTPWTARPVAGLPSVRVSWPLTITRELRRAASVEDAMRLVSERAPIALGCVSASLYSPGPKDGKHPGSSTDQVGLARRELAQRCLDSQTVVVGSGVRADATAVICYLPNGAGRRPAALILDFADQAVCAERVTECEAYAELVDSLIAHRHADEQVASLKAALDSNREIGTAMGILMATRRIDDDEAFALLRAASQHTHRKLNAIAAEVVYTGMLPE